MQFLNAPLKKNYLLILSFILFFMSTFQYRFNTCLGVPR